MGKCPDCGMNVGPFSILRSWDNWGKFVCPGCGNKIRFRVWLLAVLLITVLMVGAERLLHVMLPSESLSEQGYTYIGSAPVWVSFVVAFVVAMFIMFLIPMIWKFDKDQ